MERYGAGEAAGYGKKKRDVNLLGATLFMRRHFIVRREEMCDAERAAVDVIRNDWFLTDAVSRIEVISVAWSVMYS